MAQVLRRPWDKPRFLTRSEGLIMSTGLASSTRQDAARPLAAANTDLPDSRSRFPVAETHGIALWPGNRLIVDSGKRSWRNLYVSLATEEPWKATLPAIRHHCLAYFVSRSARITRAVAGERPVTETLLPRRFGMIPSSVASHWDVAGSPEVLLIYIRRSLVEQIAADMFDRDPAQLEIHVGLGTVDALLEQLALAVLAELRQEVSDNSLYADSLAVAISAQLLRHHCGGSHGKSVSSGRGSISRPGLRRALDYIESALEQPLGIEEIANVAGLSPVYFARAFREQTGVPPHQYVLERRVARAKTLLSTSDLPLVDVALCTGFSSQSHFSTAFKRLVGTTPGDYRRAG